MPTLSSGYIIVGAYADKLRRTMFAQVKDYIKSGQIKNQDVAKAVGDLNSKLFKILVEELKLDKGDVVRIRINYDIIDNQIVFDYDTLQIEAFKRIPVSLGWEIEKIKENDLGDMLCVLKKNNEEVGYVVVTKLDGEFLVRGAILNPPKKIIKAQVPVKNDLPEISDILEKAEDCDEETAKKIIDEIKGEFS